MTKPDFEIERLKKNVVKAKERLRIAEFCKKHGLHNFIDIRQYIHNLIIANMTLAALDLAASSGEKQVTVDVVRMVRP